jgi:hypothetical protein
MVQILILLGIGFFLFVGWIFTSIEDASRNKAQRKVAEVKAKKNGVVERLIKANL